MTESKKPRKWNLCDRRHDEKRTCVLGSRVDIQLYESVSGHSFTEKVLAFRRHKRNCPLYKVVRYRRAGFHCFKTEFLFIKAVVKSDTVAS